MASKTYRIKSDLVEKAKKKQLEYIINKKITVDEAEVINAILLKGFENLKDSDIDKYLELIEDKKINWWLNMFLIFLLNFSKIL